MGGGDSRFRRTDRLLDPEDFQQVAYQGRRAASKSFVVLAGRRRGSDLPGARLGITTSRRVGRAVQRNRVKRLVREWFRRTKRDLAGNLEVVVIARSPAVLLSQRETSSELSRLLAEADA